MSRAYNQSKIILKFTKKFIEKRYTSDTNKVTLIFFFNQFAFLKSLQNTQKSYLKFLEN